MNSQRRSKQDLSRDGVNKPLLINKIFHTIQGEGPFSGMPATFIRLAGCNLKCYWCDTKYDEKHQFFLNEIMDRVIVGGNKLVVITGGEPFRQNIATLVDRLLSLIAKVQIETSGSLSNPYMLWDGVTTVCSPKTPKLHADMLHADAWKYILQAGAVSPHDGLPSESTQIDGKISPLCRPMNDRPIYISPCDDENHKANMKAVVDSAMKYGHRVSLQTHKIMGVE